jgi:hypothetical protein
MREIPLDSEHVGGGFDGFKVKGKRGDAVRVTPIDSSR